MNLRSFQWKKPWRAIEDNVEASGIQCQLDIEISSQHPLYAKGAKVIGRRVDNDDVLAILNDGTYVIVHLVWGSGLDPHPEEYPFWFGYGSLNSFFEVMSADADEYDEP